MHIFISAGEPSGDLHGANLALALRKQNPQAKIVGFGGDRMTAAGVKLFYPLTELAMMWLGRALLNLRTFFRLADQAEDYFKTEKPDAVVLIDYPGFHWHLAKRAKAAGIPVYYFVPPQLWGWAGWRVKKMRASVEAVLTALPFEETWYAERGVNTHYVGHPYFDDLAAQTLDAEFLTSERRDPRTVVSILPGSRTQEVAGNWPIMLKAIERIHAARPGTRFLVAAFKESQAASIRESLKDSKLPVRVHVGRTPEIIELGTACIAVSGSVGLEMLYRRKPAVIVYHVGPVVMFLGRRMKSCKYISLVNLLADEELYPEHVLRTNDEPKIAEQILNWLNDPQARAERVSQLTSLRNRVAIPGACQRAAEFVANATCSRRKAA